MPVPFPMRILIADDHAVVRSGLRHVLEHEPDLKIVAEVDNGAQGPEAVHRCPCCGGRMIVIETFDGARPARSPSPTQIRIDTS